jgi:cytoskeletal protein CcmA (bactofilin family)
MPWKKQPSLPEPQSGRDRGAEPSRNDSAGRLQVPRPVADPIKPFGSVPNQGLNLALRNEPLADALAEAPDPSTPAQVPASPTAQTRPKDKGKSPPSVISEGVEIVGTLLSPGPMQFEGSMNGSISCQTLALGPTGFVIGDIDSEELHLDGGVKGTIRCETLEMGATAVAHGHLECQVLILQKGARLQGEIKVG